MWPSAPEVCRAPHETPISSFGREGGRARRAYSSGRGGAAGLAPAVFSSAHHLTVYGNGAGPAHWAERRSPGVGADR